MRITEVRLGILEVPLKTPFRTALRTVASVEGLVVAIHTDTGHVGHGGAAPTPVITGDTRGSMIEAIGGIIAPRLVGEDVADLNRLMCMVQEALRHNTSAKAAVEIAIHDLWAQLHGAPLYRMLGGGEPRLTTDITISVDGIDAMVAESLAAVELGFDALKLKLDRDSGLAIERVKAIHAAVGGRALLRLDANQAWTAKQAVQVMGRLEDAGVPLDLLEQPVPARDIAGLRYVSRRIATPVMADESVFGPLQAIELIRQRAADIINIKLMKSGGISDALRIADIAALHGVECMIGCMIETGVSVAAAAHLAVARPDVITRVDLDAPSLCAFDPVDGGVRFDGPHITIPDAPGLGIRGIRGCRPVAP